MTQGALRSGLTTTGGRSAYRSRAWAGRAKTAAAAATPRRSRVFIGRTLELLSPDRRAAGGGSPGARQASVRDCNRMVNRKSVKGSGVSKGFGVVTRRFRNLVK